MILYEARNISKEYLSGSIRLDILRGLDLQLCQGEMTAIVGASGSGKTTLLQIMGSLASPSGGELLYKGENICGKSEKELAAFRNSTIGFIFQSHHLLPEFTALENVMMPALISGRAKKHLAASAEKLLATVGLEQRIGHKVAELSGGEQQRTALARALIMKPSILLADEPTGNLDGKSGETVFSLLQSLNQSLSLTILMVTHNLELADRMDRCLTLKDGILLDMP
ncbi:MAG: ABC transporter ATP-binding protein [Deltaproteobacteria bacterium]|nr:MAG: ABC transporter ATP-binding protein [Deltaproteobacteria bacterium]